MGILIDFLKRNIAPTIAVLIIGFGLIQVMYYQNKTINALESQAVMLAKDNKGLQASLSELHSRMDIMAGDINNIVINRQASQTLREAESSKIESARGREHILIAKPTLSAKAIERAVNQTGKEISCLTGDESSCHQ
ncbi:hypothetical protein [Proteus phage PM135]|uniref:I-spanin n=1 Tax=Proteus phage PM135 TaxID=2048008 RepID=A0A2H4PRM2_9CAUD|nr:hypothetical protein FDJ15_gp079 [Proteus phage PM135]ATW69962.1 hypothetical protein [Proteus phage PM135]UXY92267.1 hypothetical protein [Proteus phage RP7]